MEMPGKEDGLVRRIIVRKSSLIEGDARIPKERPTGGSVADEGVRPTRNLGLRCNGNFISDTISVIEDRGDCMKRSSLITGLILVLWGGLALLSSLSKPRVQALHGTDILGLIGSGMCFGVAFVGLIGRLKVREDS